MTLSTTEPGHLSQRQLESTLWAAANALRGPVDPGDFKAYVFPVMFFKWISDSWDHERAQATEDFGDALTDEIESDYHTFVIPDGCHWSDVIETARQTGAKLDNALQRIQQANPDTLAGVFGDVQWANQERLPQSALAALLNSFHSVRLDPDSVNGDMLGSAYEYLLREFAEASGKKAGEFFTPRHVVHLLVKILDPKPGDTIADPACGSGGMLVETAAAVREHSGDPRTLRLHGQEINLTTSAIAKMNLYLHGLKEFKVVRGDTFREPKLLEGDGLQKFDVVIANPPFSLQNWGAEGWANDPYGRVICDVPPAKNGDFAWIQHMVASMKEDTGRVGVVMPHGVLFRGGKEGAIRECLIRKDLLESVIGLPNNLFYSTSIPVCLLIFRKQKSAERQNKVLFIDASKRFVTGKNQNTMSEEDIEVIDAAYKLGEDADGEGGLILRRVALDEIECNGFDLNIGRYLQSEKVAEANVEEALLAYQESRERRSMAETSLADKLKAAGFEI
ncbi:type I restriction-modification system subunit M [Arthrobacter cupressi]|uniref:site-specific DNA-methyltransferase (adenine-specific) n=1 Tax=Arthrobacter cupressi TaxID=1045773 RepID=A0A1G8SQW2_9MICC|nr:class I SAM-dependent DNA methyltransferase [Arthrobacter cupressi]NYD78428.1 type I restriction enzyme M protein [Arthrobacter cupressi]SDJ31597.1 type I restriction enzyme M protein [Arthrobacter cupressi]